MSTRRKSRGRQKVEMKKMSNESNLQVTFSKHRSGLFKKASELCTLCGAKVALVVFSPAEKVFSFDHPNVDIVIDRYLSLALPQHNGTMQFIETHHSANVCELNKTVTQAINQLHVEKKCGDELNNSCKATEAQFWSACPIDGMNRTQLELFKKALKELKKLVAQHVERIVIHGASTQTLPFFLENSFTSNNSVPPHQQQVQMYPLQFFQNPVTPPPHLFDFNNMGVGYGPTKFF
ncbi:agamous-like MADS-box protein AGL62 [Cicer arietinum]|uniref:Agamous-like MADS-box protein AGL62 n=1 Tax=Cicer arietinum TaxID=3827 RepID=A0A1S2XZ58_CICAR|nr:agamous-like MADS-box protein AGL62 [Cicer arietinum]